MIGMGRDTGLALTQQHKTPLHALVMCPRVPPAEKMVYAVPDVSGAITETLTSVGTASPRTAVHQPAVRTAAPYPSTPVQLI